MASGDPNVATTTATTALALLCLLACLPLPCLGGWYRPGTILSNTSNDLFFTQLRVMLNATRLSYTATYGGYYENWTVTETISDHWRKSSLEHNPEEGGMRALVFINGDEGKILIAFRGTDLTNSTSGLADQCADQYLWQGVAYNDLPDACLNFSEHTLDYLARARDFSYEVQENYFSYEIMYTGHSLGAGLAIMLSIMGNEQLADMWCGPTNAGAMAFSPPAFIQPLLNRTGTNMWNVNAWLMAGTIVAFVDVYDPIFVQANASDHGGIAATICAWADGTPSAECLACEATPAAINISSPDCGMCMAERHMFAHYMGLRRTSPVCYGKNDCGRPTICFPSGSNCLLWP